MVRVFRVRLREYAPSATREPGPRRDWRPANPFRFPWQKQDSDDQSGGKRAGRRHVKRE